jgi:hypothetical protein
MRKCFHTFLQPCNKEQRNGGREPYLVEEEPAGQSSNVESPGARITNPPIPLLLRVAVDGPLRVRQQLHKLLRLGIAEGITHRERLHCMQRVGRGAVEVVSAVRKVARVSASNSRSVHPRVIWRTILQTIRPASQQKGIHQERKTHSITYQTLSLSLSHI